VVRQEPDLIGGFGVGHAANSLCRAENVSGVTKVHDHLCWVEPMSGMHLNSPEDESLWKVP
jgi:hypothetical protein